MTTKRLREARDVGAAAAAGQAHGRPPPVADVGRVQVAVAVDLGAADEAEVDQPLLEQAHHLERARAPERARDVRRVAHRHQRLGGRLVAHDAVLEDAEGARGVRALGEGEGHERQPHADEDDVAVPDLAAGRDHHQLAVGVGVRHRLHQVSTKGLAAAGTNG